ncbi:MAG: PKD domain-containing protein [Thermoplasmata archaeon]|nr:PKD domain-containing protein [Thermoplasmata archaeon]
MGSFSSNNSIYNCNIISNGWYGIYLDSSNDNLAYLNNFISNIVDSYNSNNTWHSPEPINYTYNGRNYTNYLGNYWSNYNGSDADNDGIGDTPYHVGESDYDYYPLMKPWENYFNQNVPPVANFTWHPANPTDLDIVHFTDLSYDSDGSIVNWTWNFGDGSYAYGQNPQHRYADDGTYNVTLTVRDDDGATNSTTKQIVVSNVPPVANFIYSPSNPTDLDIVHFTDLSYDNDGFIVNWTWSFGDGEISYEQNPSHKYADDGTYNVTLTVTDDDGATNSTTKQIVVSNVPPVANFTWHPANPKVEQNITFDASLSYDSDGNIVNYTWQFGNSVAYGRVVIHSYAYVGKYNVTLIVTDNDGATAIVTKSIKVIYPPSPPKPPELPEPEKFIYFIGPHEWNETRWLVTPETLICFDMDLLISNGIIELFYQIDYKGWNEYRDCFNLSLGKHFIYYYGKDEYGLKSSVASVCIEVVESLSPTTNIILSPSHPDGNNGWYRSTVTISFDAYDDAGINATYYRIDDGKWMKYENPIKISSDGKHIISFYSIDEYGNKEAMKTKEIKIDRTMPQISFKTPAHCLYIFGRKLIPLKNTIIIGKAFVEVNANDNIGIEKIEFYFDGELKSIDNETPYQWQWDEAAIGKHEIMVKAYDEAGNVVTANQKIWVFNPLP